MDRSGHFNNHARSYTFIYFRWIILIVVIVLVVILFATGIIKVN